MRFVSIQKIKQQCNYPVCIFAYLVSAAAARTRRRLRGSAVKRRAGPHGARGKPRPVCGGENDCAARAQCGRRFSTCAPACLFPLENSAPSTPNTAALNLIFPVFGTFSSHHAAHPEAKPPEPRFPAAKQQSPPENT